MSLSLVFLIIFLAVTGALFYALYHYRERLEILKEFFEFLKRRKLWWIIPIIITLLVLSILIAVFETGALSSTMYILF
jgi:heme/copper-type cytochrome/quinol oxidase subunit 2